MTPFLRMTLVFVLLSFARPALSHEFWIEAQTYQVRPGGQIEAGLYNGQYFTGVEMAWFETRISHAGWMQGADSGGFDSRSGDRPALKLPAPGPGLVQLLYQSTARKLTYTDWGKFENFAASKGNGWAIARHAERGLLRTGFSESYTRYCKALVAVGDGAGADRATGMEVELVALSNPYTEPPQAGLRVEMRYKGRPLPETQIDVFEKKDDGPAESFHVITDLAGRATVPLKPGHRYLLDSVVLREPETDGPHVWESLWASLTFEVPR
ncbi:DUF4198 domain-containing protein [Marimonas arenosa]|uniref:DUF4198 domain-containing protein n=1 Tax=Marimonas arenosa TaxID=1795305 RepID=A0AAE4B3Q1_9RHOB|nr:DUF4198 domain-containing protein [Marimonas arenosa]MDQ2088624.1 DUF4198 domain-containing protein [Marimonas arenosa]